MTLPITLGAPNLYVLPDEPIRALTSERMDVCAFVGVAPRGPARLPVFDAAWVPPGRVGVRSVAVAVESWDHYVRLYGRFEGPGRLPYAVASFFENGGRRAWVVRIVHDYRLPNGDLDTATSDRGVAHARFEQLTAGGTRKVWLRARNEGAWGNRLRATLAFQSRALALEPAQFAATEIRYGAGLALTVGSALRITLDDGTSVVRYITAIRHEWQPERRRSGLLQKDALATLGAPLPGPVRGAELIEGVLELDDGDGRHERHEQLGLSSLHARWLAAVLIDESELAYPALDPTRPATDPLASWLDTDIDVDAELTARKTSACGHYRWNHPADQPPEPVQDRYADLVPGDLFDELWVAGDEVPGSGIQAIAELSDVSLLVVPDLYSPAPLAPRDVKDDPGGLAGPEFATCVEPAKATEPERPNGELVGLTIDPNPGFAEIVDLQRRVIDFADRQQSFVALLDVPPRLSPRRVLAWRGSFDSAYAAAYHPWVSVDRPDDDREGLSLVPPSAVAAGIIAARELAHGVPYGPANAVAIGVVKVAERISPARHDELHPLGINVFLPERDGVRLTAARTLSSDPQWRQLSVRRLITLLRRVLERQMQWAVFEPNDDALRADVRHAIEAYLRQLFLANAFTGAREEDAFFVRCDTDLNPPAIVDQGKLIAHVGVAPAEPLEFIVLRIARDGDGTLRVEG